MSAHCNDKLATTTPPACPRSIQVNSGQFLGWGSAPGPSSAWAVHTLAMRRKCRCKAGLCRSPTNCMQCAAKRMHSRACFRKRSDLDTARLLGTPTLEHRTASRARRWPTPHRNGGYSPAARGRQEVAAVCARSRLSSLSCCCLAMADTLPGPMLRSIGVDAHRAIALEIPEGADYFLPRGNLLWSSRADTVFARATGAFVEEKKRNRDEEKKSSEKEKYCRV